MAHRIEAEIAAGLALPDRLADALYGSPAITPVPVAMQRFGISLVLEAPGLEPEVLVQTHIDLPSLADADDLARRLSRPPYREVGHWVRGLTVHITPRSA